MLMTKRPVEAGDAGAREVAALHDDRGVERRRRRRSAISMPATPGNAMQRRRRRVALTTRDVLAERAQRVGHRQLRADGVAVGPRVRRRARSAGAARIALDDLRASSGLSRRRASSAVGLGHRVGVARRSVARGSRCRICSMRSWPRDRLVEDGTAAPARAAAAAAGRSAGAGTAPRARAPSVVCVRALSSPSAV